MFIEGGALNKQVIEASICIVGAGAAGIAIANEFIGTDVPVVMIESGGFSYDSDVQALCNGDTTGMKYDLLHSRLRYFGGSTNHWAGMCAPLDEIDFEARDWIPHSGWPITRSDLVPYYQKASSFLNLGGNNSADFSTPQDIFALDRRLMFKRWRMPAKRRLGAVYHDALKEAGNIRIILNSTVTNIETNDDASVVTGVKASTLQKQSFTVKAKYFILAGGGIENARMLLLSRDRVPAGLGNMNDLVGRYFMEHLHCEPGAIFGFVAGGPLAMMASQRPHRTAFSITPTRETLEKYRILNGSLEILPGQEVLQHHVPGMVSYMRGAMGTDGGKVMHYPIRMRNELAPNPKNRITLSDTRRDSLGLPVTQLFIKHNRLVWQSAHAMCKLGTNALSAAELGIVFVKDWIVQFSDEWPPLPHGHHIGTTRMHEDAKQGVVDKDCRVHGINNLHIAGCSVFPTAGYVNPTYTLIALALRLSEHVKQLVSA